MICLQILTLSLLLSSAHSQADIDCDVKTDFWTLNKSVLEIDSLDSEHLNFTEEFEDCISEIKEIVLNEAFHDILPTSITVIDENSKLISRHNLKAVEKFYSIDGSFTSIERKNFMKMIHLNSLNLKNGKLGNICGDSFMDLLSLNVLNLSSNEIKFIHPNLFKMLKNLTYLVLNQNLIEYLHPQTFWTLKKLEHLNLSGNRLIYLQQSHFIKNSKLDMLNIRNNNFDYIQENTFDNLKLSLFSVNNIKCAKNLPAVMTASNDNDILDISKLKADLIAKNCTLKTENIIRRINQKVDEFRNYFKNNNCSNETAFDDF